MVGPWCQGASDRAQNLTLQAATYQAQASRLYCHLSTTLMPSDIEKYIFSDIQSWASGATRV
jgi:hypothetical protein